MLDPILHPAIIADDALGVQHGAVPLIDPDPASEQVPVADPRKVADQRKIARSRHQKPDVHPIARRIAQRLEQSGRSNQIRVSDPEPFDATRSQQLDDTIRALPPGLSADHPYVRRPSGLHHPGHEL